MGRRQKAKTGDKGLYKLKKQLEDEQQKASRRKDDGDDENDPMYDHVDRFHNQRDKDFLKLDGGDDDESSDADAEEAVMDLGLGVGGGEESSDEEEDDDDDDDDMDDGVGHTRVSSKGSAADDSSSSSSSSDDDDDDDDEEAEEQDVRDWGKKKSLYYHGDTADLEIGQEEEDAFEEEEAAKEIQAARFQEMSEDDFVLPSDGEDNEKGGGRSKKSGKKSSKETREEIAVTSSSGASHRDDMILKLSTKEKRKLLDKQHSEMLPLLSHFHETVQDLEANTSVATRALFEADEEGTPEAVGATDLGQQYLLTKALLQTSTALNLAMYLLIKSEQANKHVTVDETTNINGAVAIVEPSSIQSHPIISRLQQLNDLSHKLKDSIENNVPGLTTQLQNIVKAAALLNEGVASSGSSSSGSEESDGDSDDSDNENPEHDSDRKETKVNAPKGKNDDDSASTSSSSSSPSVDDGDDEEAKRRSVINEARFGLRANEIKSSKNRVEKSKLRRSQGAIDLDYGDDVTQPVDPKVNKSALSSTLASMEQRAATRQRRAAVMMDDAEKIDEPKEDDGEVRRALEMMEAELGKASDDEDNVDANDVDDGDDDMGDYGNGPERMYEAIAKRSKERKEERKKKYEVAPKFPRVEKEIEGERSINKAILKNRGLVAHKAKINRNPRVKKREQYRKAVIRRKGAVRDVRTDEGHKYGGEMTGIKSSVSRSRKL